MTAWLDIVGVTEGGIEALPDPLRAIVAGAETVIGPERLLPPAGGTQNVTAWTAPLEEMVAQVLACRDSSTVVLATGDPNWYGIGATLGRYLASDEFNLHPAPSAFQLAAARMHWPLQNVATLSLHGRPVTALHPHLVPRNRVLALTGGAETTHQVAALLTARGYGQSRLTILENLGAATERMARATAAAAQDRRIGDFHVLAIDCVADPDAPLLPPLPGLPDDAFVSDGQFTKREVRAATLAKLAPFAGDLLWDVGAGCGSVAIEWARAARDARALCFERAPERLAMIAANGEALGAPMLTCVGGEAPASLTGQPAPDAVFLGGDVANDELFAACWRALKPGGRLVANAVTIEAEQALYARHNRLGGDLARLDISHLGNVGPYRALRPRMAVVQWLVLKGTQ